VVVGVEFASAVAFVVLALVVPLMPIFMLLLGLVTEVVFVTMGHAIEA